MPIQRRTPKRGFINHTRVEYQSVAVARLSGAEAVRWSTAIGCARRG
jgi:ribosomal protein L15